MCYHLKNLLFVTKREGLFFLIGPQRFYSWRNSNDHFKKIINADFVYVYDKNGYIGKTTCYEIGFCFSKKKPIFFYEMPDDLPIPVCVEKQVLTPKKFVDCISAEKPE